MIRSATIGGDCLRTSLSGYFSEKVDILRSTSTQDAFGEPIETWACVPDLTELPALIAGGDVSVRLKRQEMRTNMQTYEMEYRRVLLNGRYSVLHEDRARFQGRDWAVVSVVTDVTGTFTELLCQVIDPGVI